MENQEKGLSKDAWVILTVMGLVATISLSLGGFTYIGLRDLRAETKADAKEFRDEVNGRFDKLETKIEKVDEKVEKVEEKVDRVKEHLHKLEIAVTAHVAGHSLTPNETTSADAPAAVPDDNALPADIPAQDNEIVDVPSLPEKAAIPQEPGQENPTIPEPENLT